MSSMSPPLAVPTSKRTRFADPIASGVSADDLDLADLDHDPASPTHQLHSSRHRGDDDDDDDDEDEDDDEDMGKTARERLASALTSHGAADARPGPATAASSGAAGSSNAPTTMQLLYRADDNQVRAFVETIADEDQRERFYAFRRIKFNNPTIRRLTTAATGASSIAKSVPMVMGAVARTYLSEILDLARKSMVAAGEDPNGPMGPHHLREGYRQYHARGKGLPTIHHQPVRRRLF